MSLKGPSLPGVLGHPLILSSGMLGPGWEAPLVHLASVALGIGACNPSSILWGHRMFFACI